VSDDLSFPDVVPILRRLEGVPFVLIGGQAVNFWATLYIDRAPELTEQGPHEPWGDCGVPVVNNDAEALKADFSIASAKTRAVPHPPICRATSSRHAFRSSKVRWR
jgi:hypothetical protein